MKWILTGLLLFSAIPILADNSYTYEELPECFFEVDSAFVLHGEPNNIFAERVIAIDTCGALDIIGMPFWHTPVNSRKNISKLSDHRLELLEADKIFSNHILSLHTSSELKSIFKEQNEFKDIDSVDISEIKDELPEIKALFEDLTDSVGTYQIYINNYQENSNNKYEAIRFDLVFDSYVSVKYVLNMLEQVNITTLEHFFYAAPSSIKSAMNFDIQIRSNSIEISNAKAPLEIGIYDLTGILLKSMNNINDKDFSLDMSAYKKGVYFVRINNHIVKYIGIR